MGISMPVSRTLTPARRVVAALAAAVAVAALTHVSTVLVFFVVNGSKPENIVPISNYFMPGTLVLALVVAIVASVGALRRWYFAVVTGLIGGALASFLGTAFGYQLAGVSWNADVPSFLATTLVGTGLVFIVAATLASLFVAPRLFGWVSSLRVGSSRPIALVRQPSSRLADGELTHLDRVAVDLDLADDQWQAYVSALEEHGFEVVDVTPADELPDSVFIEDALVIFGSTAVITSPGAETRRPETDAARESAHYLGLRVQAIELPGTLDGGDVLKVGSTVYVGRSGRTNAEGIRQLRAIISPLGYTVVAVPVKKVLHLKSAVTALPDGTVIGYAKHVDNPAIFDRFLAMPEPGAAVVVLSADTVLMASSVPKSAALVADLGYRVITVDVSEFEKLEGCVTCLSVRVR